MRNLPIYASNFASFRVCEATCETEDGQVDILLEFRQRATEEQLLYTTWRGQATRATSIHELVAILDGMICLQIRHTVCVLWNGVSQKAEVSETFSHTQHPEGHPIANLRVGLTINGKRYQSQSVATLQDAILDLREQLGDEVSWRIETCYECAYSGQARDYATSDREYWCYRDAPGAWPEIRAKGKYATPDARFAGDYFVDAFHSCAAWMPLA